MTELLVSHSFLVLRERKLLTYHKQCARELISTRKTSQAQQHRPQSPLVTLTWHPCKCKVHKLHQRYILEVEFMYLVFTCMLGESYWRQLKSLLLCLCEIVLALISSLVCWSCTSALGLMLFQIYFCYKRPVFWLQMRLIFMLLCCAGCILNTYLGCLPVMFMSVLAYFLYLLIFSHCPCFVYIYMHVLIMVCIPSIKDIILLMGG